jgi:hypothetical protein
MFSLHADVLSVSEGTLDMNTSTNIFLPATATGDACLTATIGGNNARGADFKSPDKASVGFGAPVACNNVFFVRSANQRSIFYTYYDRKSYLGFRGNAPAAKFPAPVTADAGLQVASPVGGNGATGVATPSTVPEPSFLLPLASAFALIRKIRRT